MLVDELITDPLELVPWMVFPVITRLSLFPLACATTPAKSQLGARVTVFPVIVDVLLALLWKAGLPFQLPASSYQNMSISKIGSNKHIPGNRVARTPRNDNRVVP